MRQAKDWLLQMSFQRHDTSMKTCLNPVEIRGIGLRQAVSRYNLFMRLVEV